MEKKAFTTYEYKQISVPASQASMYLDCYEAFGWEEDGYAPAGPQLAVGERHMQTLRLKRSRKLVNRVELTRLQRHFEASMREIDQLEQSKTTSALIWALSIGIVGTAFMAGSVFAATADPPRWVLSILLAIPAFAGWIAPYFVYRRRAAAREAQVRPLIEEKLDEISALCEKGQSLL